jgi:hypothetical protein
MGEVVKILKKPDGASAVHYRYGTYFMNRTTTESLSHSHGVPGPTADKTNLRHNTYVHLTVSAWQYLQELLSVSSSFRCVSKVIYRASPHRPDRHPDATVPYRLRFR